MPLGVSAHTTEDELRVHSSAEAVAVLETVERWQERYLRALGRRLVFAADEYYLMAQAAFPATDAYDGFPQHENGIGMARTFADEVHAALRGEGARAKEPHTGFFGWVDGAPASGYRAPRIALGPQRNAAPRRTALITGEYGSHVLTPLLKKLGEVARALGPDGFLYASTSNCDGRADCPPEKDAIVRIVPLAPAP